MGEATNFGAPLNTSGDEQGLVVSTSTEAFSLDGATAQAWTSSAFPSLTEMKPESVFIVGRPARLCAVPEEPGCTSICAIEKRAGNRGEPPGRPFCFGGSSTEDVLLVAKADGIAFEAQVVFDADSETSPPTDWIPPWNSKRHQRTEIGDIQFATNSAEINRTSLLMLDLFAAYLLRNDAIGVHIKGHTDDRGRPEDNQVLSENRAAQVAAALEQFGVPSNRITYAGFGQSAPVASNATAEGRSQNRRTEFEIRLGH